MSVVSAQIPIDAAPGSVEYRLRAADPYRLDYMPFQVGAFVKIDVGTGGCFRDIRVGRKMDHGPVAGHRPAQKVLVLYVRANHTEAGILQVLSKMPFAAGGKIVIDGDLGHGRIGQ